jgi:hypothetical protein
MTGLPRIQTTYRRKPVWDMVLLGGIERLTERLMSGAEFSEDDLHDMRALRARLRGFETALDARERAAGIVIEETEE